MKNGRQNERMKLGFEVEIPYLRIISLIFSNMSKKLGQIIGSKLEPKTEKISAKKASFHKWTKLEFLKLED